MRTAALLLALGPRPDPDDIARLLHENIPYWKDIAKVATSLLGVLAKDAQPHTVCAVLRALAVVGIEVNVYHYNAAIGSCRKKGQWPWAINILADISRSSLQPTTSSFNAAISTCRTGACWELAVRLLSEMRVLGIVPDIISYSAVASACQEGGAWSQALVLLGSMTKAEVKPDTMFFSSLISASAKVGEWQHAEQLLAQMSEERVKANAITYNAVAAAFSEGMQWERTLQFMKDMPSQSAIPDAYTFSAAMRSCSKGSEWTRALGLLDEMERHRVKPSVVTCSAAVSACQQGAAWEAALAIFSLMAEGTIGVDTIGHNAVVNACTWAGQWAWALMLLSEMPEGTRDPLSYRSACRACVVGADSAWEKVAMLLAQMTSQNLALDRDTYSIVLMECEQQQLPRPSVLLKLETSILKRLAVEADGFEGTASMRRLVGMKGAVVLATSMRLLSKGKPRMAAKVLQAAAKEGHINEASAHFWTANCQQLGLPPRKLQTPGHAAVASRIDVRAPYAKELGLLQHVLANAKPGDATSACSEADRFGTQVWKSQGVWFFNAGGAKTDVLTASMRAAGPHGDVLEIGAYIGYSAARIALASKASVTTIEVDPVHMVIARNFIAMAGLSGQVTVWTGHSDLVLPRLVRHALFSAVFMDRWGSEYPADLVQLEKLNLVAPHCLVVADNLLRTGASKFLWRAAALDAGNNCKTQLLTVCEYATGTDDWMSVSVDLLSASDLPRRPNKPLTVELDEIHRMSEELRARVISAGTPIALAERDTFTATFRSALSCVGIERTASSLRDANTSKQLKL